MNKTMKAAVVRAFDQPLAIEEVPVPRPGAGDVLVKIEACGVCHTDLHTVHGDWPDKPTLPRIPGHEAVGEVVEIGPRARGIEDIVQAMRQSARRTDEIRREKRRAKKP